MPNPDRRAPRILYVQFTAPAALPPLEHSARLLAEAGCEVRLLGVEAADVGQFRLVPHPRVEERVVRIATSGPQLKLAFLTYAVRVLVETLRWRPDWVYVSDTLNTPIGLLVAKVAGARFIYHEHDAPSPTPRNAVDRLLRRTRAWCMRHADRVVFPNVGRYEEHGACLGVSAERVAIVWNCPELAELPSLPARRREARALSLLYHGSITPDRLPIALLDALTRTGVRVTLTVVGYETIGARGYVARLLERARELGLGDRVRVLPPAVTRRDLYALSVGHDLGLCFVGAAETDVNMRTMVGASNKAFDYLACGLALLVPPVELWERTFVEPGYGVAADASDVGLLAERLRVLAASPDALAEMVRRGRRRIETEWNYDARFATLRDYMLARATCDSSSEPFVPDQPARRDPARGVA